MKKYIIILILLLTSIMLFAAGSSEEVGISSITAIDSLERTITLESKPERIAIVGKSGLMPAEALYLFPESYTNVVGLTKTNQGLGDFFTALSNKEIARFDQNASAEVIASMNPDLVLIKEFNYNSIGITLEKLGIPVFCMNLETSKEWKTEILELGKIIANEERALEIQKIIDDFEVELDSSVSTTTNRPSVLALQFSTVSGVTSFSVAPDSWIQTEIIEKAGGVNANLGRDLTSTHWSTISFEEIAAMNPDYIVITSYKTPAADFLDEIYSSSLWLELTSTQNNNVIVAPSDYIAYMQPSTRYILCEYWLSNELHPELNIDMEKELKTYFESFFMIEDKLNDFTTRYNKSIEANK